MSIVSARLSVPTNAEFSNTSEKIYRDLGVRLEYRPDEAIVAVEVAPAACTTARVGEET
ncbi:MAG: hypothetical protein ACRDKB_04290 [Actinomycetota bacterium]